MFLLLCIEKTLSPTISPTLSPESSVSLRFSINISVSNSLPCVPERPNRRRCPHLWALWVYEISINICQYIEFQFSYTCVTERLNHRRFLHLWARWVYEISINTCQYLSFKSLTCAPERRYHRRSLQVGARWVDDSHLSSHAPTHSHIIFRLHHHQSSRPRSRAWSHLKLLVNHCNLLQHNLNFNESMKIGEFDEKSWF